MKNEIKEILDYLKIENGTIGSELSYKETHLLLDYITNLQKENEKYKKIFEGKEKFSKIMPDDIDFIIMSKADYDRQQKDIELELIDYKSRNEKAVEYIKDTRDITDEEYDEGIVLDYNIIKNELLNILKGEDEE